MSAPNYNEIIDFLPNLSEKVPVTDEKFLFFFDPKIVDETLLFGLSLKTGVYIISIFILLQGLNAFFKIFEPDSFWIFIISIFAFLIYFSISFYAFMGVYNNNYRFLKVSYLAISLLFIIEALKYLSRSVYRVIKFITPWEGSFLKQKLLIYVFGYGVYLLIYLYLIYALYKYMLQAKNSSQNEQQNDSNLNDKKDEPLIVNEENNEKKE